MKISLSLEASQSHSFAVVFLNARCVELLAQGISCVVLGDHYADRRISAIL